MKWIQIYYQGKIINNKQVYNSYEVGIHFKFTFLF